MYIWIIFVVWSFSVIDLKSADFALVNSCFKRDALWKDYGWNNTITTIWCKNKCRDAVDKFRYYGTSYKNCYCRETELSMSDQMTNEKCNKTCEGNLHDKCGGGHGLNYLINVAKMYRPPNTVTAKVTQTTSITPMPEGKLTTTTFMKMISTETSPAAVTNSMPLNTRKSIASTSENTQTSLSTELTENVTHASTGMRPRKLLCKCPKRLINRKWHFLDGNNITDAEVKELVLEDFNKNIKSEITVDKKTVSKEVRKKNSSVNKIKSAQPIGWGCTVFLILPMVFLIAVDILNCCIHFRARYDGRKRKQNRITAISVIQDHADIAHPPKENVDNTEEFYASRCGNNSHPDKMKRETYRRRRDQNYQQNREERLQYI